MNYNVAGTVKGFHRLAIVYYAYCRATTNLRPSRRACNPLDISMNEWLVVHLNDKLIEVVTRTEQITLLQEYPNGSVYVSKMNILA